MVDSYQKMNDGGDERDSVVFVVDGVVVDSVRFVQSAAEPFQDLGNQSEIRRTEVLSRN